MKTTTKALIVITNLLLVSCVNQNTKISDNIMPTTNACAKLNLLKSAYHDDFNQIKEIKMGARVSNIWRAKYQLFGENCQVFSWGGNAHNYSCSLVAPDEETAENYYQSAKRVTQQCLGEEWLLNESKRKHDDGMKAVFLNDKANPEQQVSFSTHLVATEGLFSTKWSIFYYVGNSTPPTN